MILSGTGSRSLEIADTDLYLEVSYWILDQIEIYQPEYVLSGMAEGFDSLLAQAALNIQIPVIAAVPNRGYGAYYWGQKSLTKRNRLSDFDELLARCEDVVYVCGNQLTKNGVHSNFVRNQYMVDRADHFLVYEPTSRGTSDCVRRLEKAGCPYSVFE